MTSQRLLALLNYVYLLLVMFVIAGILTAAMTLQYANGELPCPLCLLERVAMFGVCFGIMLNFRRGFSYQNTGFSSVVRDPAAGRCRTAEPARHLSASGTRVHR